MLLGRAESHHLLHAGPVVPRAVEQHHFTGGRQVGHVTLEVPLCLFALGRFFQCHHPGGPGVQVLHEPLNGAAFAGGVASLEQDHVPGAGASAVILQLEQFYL